MLVLAGAPPAANVTTTHFPGGEIGEVFVLDGDPARAQAHAARWRGRGRAFTYEPLVPAASGGALSVAWAKGAELTVARAVDFSQVGGGVGWEMCVHACSKGQLRVVVQLSSTKRRCVLNDEELTQRVPLCAL